MSSHIGTPAAGFAGHNIDHIFPINPDGTSWEGGPIELQRLFAAILHKPTPSEGSVEMQQLVAFTGLSVEASIARLKEAKEARRTIEEKTTELQSRVLTILDRENPDQFTPSWIRAQDYNLYGEIYQLSSEDSLFSWCNFIEGLGAQWLRKFDFKASSISDIADAIYIRLKTDQPETWNIEWLRTNHPRVHDRVLEFFRRRQAAVDWGKIITHGHPLLKSSYDPDTFSDLEDVAAKEIDQEAMKKECAEAVTDYLLELDQETWSPSTLSCGNKIAVAYMQIRILYSKAEGEPIQWAKFIQTLPVPLQNRFEMLRITNKTLKEYPAEAALYIESSRRRHQKALAQLLEEKNPDEFNPGWIKSNNPSLYSKLQTFQKKDPNFTWYRFVKGVPGDWIEKFYSVFKLNSEIEAYLKNDDDCQTAIAPQILEIYMEEKELFIANMTKVLQSRLRKVLEAEQPDQFTPGWLDRNDLGERKHGALRRAIKILEKIDENFCWYEFLKGVGENWLMISKLKCFSVKDFASLWAIILKQHDVKQWNLPYLRSNHYGFADKLASFYSGSLKRPLDWGEFLAELPDDAQKTYEEFDTSPEARQARIIERGEERIRITAKKLEEFLIQNDMINDWSLDQIQNLDPSFFKYLVKKKFGDMPGPNLKGIATCFKHLSTEALEGFSSSHPVTPHQCLAERVNRYIGDKYPHGWNLNSIKNDKLRKALKLLGKRIEVTLRYVSTEIARAFERDPAKAGVDSTETVNAVRSTTAALTSATFEKVYSAEKVAAVETILDQTGYSFNQGISYKLFSRLMKLYHDDMNEYALTMAESILHEFFEENYPEFDYKSLPTEAFIDHLNEGGDFQMQVIYLARRIKKSQYT